MGRVAAGTEVVKPPTFNGISSKVSGFITACKLYIKIKIRKAIVEKQIQWVLSYVQGGLVDSVGIIIYARRISRHLKEKCLGGVGRRKIGI